MTYDFKLTHLVVAVLFLGGAVNAQTVTFHEDIAPLIYTQCTECHREGEIGPMPFTTYEEVSAFGSFIEYVTQTNYMPPWTPDHNYSFTPWRAVFDGRPKSFDQRLGAARNARG